jgi:Undecaprenyl-phosphate glucose phosphotransferase
MSLHIDETWDTDTQLPKPKLRIRTEWIAVAADALPLWDAISIAVVGYLSTLTYIRFFIRLDVAESFTGDTIGLSLLGGLLGAFVFQDGPRKALGNTWHRRSLIEVACDALWRAVLLVSLLLAIMFLTRIGDRVPRLWLLTWAAMILVVTLGERLLLSRQLSALQARGTVRERVAVIGSGPLVEQLIRRLSRERGASFELAGVFAHNPTASTHIHGNNNDNDFPRLLEFGKRHEIDLVVLALSEPAPDHLDQIVHDLKALDVKVAVLPPFYDFSNSYIELQHFGTIPMMMVVDRPINTRGLLAKEVTDKIVAVLAIVALAPLMLVISLAIRLESPGGIIFRQKRHGRNNSVFEVFKFRTMRASPLHAIDGRVQTRRNDSRITRTGAFLRASSLDELPQLFNVLLGDMSIVGPRPHPCEMRTEDKLSAEIAADYTHRHRVKPGITGWAQINGSRGATETAAQVRQRIAYDLFYIDNWSFLLDLKILLITPFKLIFDRDGAY